MDARSSVGHALLDLGSMAPGGRGEPVEGAIRAARNEVDGSLTLGTIAVIGSMRRCQRFGGIRWYRAGGGPGLSSGRGAWLGGLPHPETRVASLVRRKRALGPC